MSNSKPKSKEQNQVVDPVAFYFKQLQKQQKWERTFNLALGIKTSKCIVHPKNKL